MTNQRDERLSRSTADDDDILFQDPDSDEELFATDEKDELFADEPKSDDDDDTTWKVMIVDDEEDVHQLTRFVLEDYQYLGKKLNFVSAYSAEEAKVLLEKHSNPAVILLDVVMETNDAGLQLVEYIRETRKNPFTRIILRTGQPGYAPEKQIILKYDINDYKNKTELTDQKLFTVVTASLRAFSDLMTIESYRQHLEAKVAERTKELQQKNDELLLANQKLLDLNRDKNEFLGIVAHDLKNPLSSIQSLANLIKTSMDEFPPVKIAEFAHMIEASSQKMFVLIKNLLDVNAIESGKINFSFNTLDLRFFVQSVLKNYQDAANGKKIKLHYQPPSDKALILADQMATLQILDNIISNAVKYSPHGKAVYLNIININNKIRFEVQDEGMGISKVEQEKLFGKFSRLTPRPTGNEHSTGLGLFIVKKLVETMHGVVWCESELGKGSKFIIEFPQAQEKNQNPLMTSNQIHL
jgi:signal transduction histidine kinase